MAVSDYKLNLSPEEIANLKTMGYMDLSGLASPPPADAPLPSGFNLDGPITEVPVDFTDTLFGGIGQGPQFDFTEDSQSDGRNLKLVGDTRPVEDLVDLTAPIQSGPTGNTGSESYGTLPTWTEMEDIKEDTGSGWYEDTVIDTKPVEDWAQKMVNKPSRLFPSEALDPPLKADGTPDWMAHVSRPTDSLLPQQLQSAQRQRQMTPANQLVGNPLMQGNSGVPTTAMGAALRGGQNG